MVGRGGVGTQAELDMGYSELSRWEDGKQRENRACVFCLFLSLWRFLPVDIDAEPGGLGIPALLH